MKVGVQHGEQMKQTIWIRWKYPGYDGMEDLFPVELFTNEGTYVRQTHYVQDRKLELHTAVFLLTVRAT